jgi:hypothetical protein
VKLDLDRSGADLLPGPRVSDWNYAVVVLTELLADRRVGLLQLESNGAGVQLADAVDVDRTEAAGPEQPLRGVEHALNRVHDVVGRERLAVVEGDSLPEADRPRVRSILRHRLGEAIGGQVVALVVDQKRFEAGHQASLVGLGDDVLAVDDVLGAAAGHA